MDNIRFGVEMCDEIDLLGWPDHYRLRPMRELDAGVYLTLGYYGLEHRLLVTRLKALRVRRDQLYAILYEACTLQGEKDTLNQPVLQAVREAREYVLSSSVEEYIVG